MGLLENQAVLELFCCSAALHLPAPLIERGIADVEVLGVQVILGDAQSIPEPLVMHDLPLAEELDGLSYVGIVAEAEDVVVGDAGLLLC